jgi:hypothetical protein
LTESKDKLGLIAGNGRFPFLLLDAARAHGTEVVVAAIKEETDPEMDARAAADPGVRVHWLSLGELSRLIETFQREGVHKAVMAGQVKHKLIASTAYLEPLLAQPGVLTARAPNEQEERDIAYGREMARGLAAFDLGQTVVVAAQACIAIEAMEGTDATIQRAGELMLSLGDPASTLHPSEQSSPGTPLLDRSLTVVKVAKPKQDLRFDVPVIGIHTIETMRAAGATCLALEAHRTLIFDRDAVRAEADAAGIAVIALENG